MSLYNWLVVWIAIMSAIACNFKIKNITQLVDFDDRSKKKGFVFWTFVPIILLTGLRGNITIDYNSYKRIYNNIRPISFKEIVKEGSEIGYGLLQKVVGELTDYDFIILMFVIALITVSIYYYVFWTYSKSMWLSILLLMILGSYYTFFNTIRQFMAGAMFLIAGIFAWKRKIVGYFITVLIISTFHKSAIVMIPFYWLLNINWKSKKQVILSVLCVGGAFAMLVYLPSLVNFATQFLYSGYSADKTLRGDLSTGILSILRPLFFLGFTIINSKVIDWNSRRDRWLVNCVIYFLFFQVASYRVYMLYRFTYYFLLFIMILIPELIYRNKKNKTWNWLIIISVMLIYFTISQVGLEYRFYWEEEMTWWR